MMKTNEISESFLNVVLFRRKRACPLDRYTKHKRHYCPHVRPARGSRLTAPLEVSTDEKAKKRLISNDKAKIKH
uniref:Uncharacterized protein n=1 Tax=Romanomermis culicivorax TaxID=13658 RepID=A0A915JVB5_ROMCU